MSVQKRVELITTGEELLLGLTANNHLTYIGGQLAARGLALERNIVVSDDAATIAAQFRESWARADLVITTGGLGPTSDDRCREVIAEILGQKLVLDPEIEIAVRKRFEQLGRKMPPNNLKQAYRPEHAEVLVNPNGTAPGLWVEQDGRILVMLPGPPNELMPMFAEQVVPRLVARGWLGAEESYVQICTAGIGESALETLLAPVFEEYAGLGIAYCAHHGRVDVRLNSPDARYSRVQLQIIANHCREKLGLDFVCFGDDPMVKIVADLLRLEDHDVAVAESCTGGLLAHAFTEIRGAGKVFAGGIICHSNDCKVQLLDVPECLLKQHGAVSAEAAVAMAAGVAERLEATYGLAICGFGGSCGGTNEVGTIYIGLHSPNGAWSRRLNFPGCRVAMKQRAVTAAVDWLRRELIRVRASRAPVNGQPAPATESVEDPARAEARKLLGLRRRC